jgi:crotonobetainyl-CoA:carnitine CoA-transferase CaiB-like acyl-CoA transferase
MTRTPADPTRPAPAFGEHTEEVLREAGYSAEEIAAMLESAAAAGPTSTHMEFRA